MRSLRERAWIPGAASLAAAALLALGGAAARPGGMWLGVPPAAAVVVVVLVVIGLAMVPGARMGLAASVGLLLPVGLIAAGVPLDGVRAVAGEPLLALAVAGLAIAVAASGQRLPRLIFLPAVFLLYVVVAGREQVQVGPRGDEPHYLMVADSRATMPPGDTRRSTTRPSPPTTGCGERAGRSTRSTPWASRC
jgi:hypothetical protein